MKDWEAAEGIAGTNIVLGFCCEIKGKRKRKCQSILCKSVHSEKFRDWSTSLFVEFSDLWQEKELERFNEISKQKRPRGIRNRKNVSTMKEKKRENTKETERDRERLRRKGASSL